MFSASKLWPSRLFGRDKDRRDATFVPTTAMAARIVATAKAGAVLVEPPTSFDTLSGVAPAELSPPDSDSDAVVDAAERQADRFVPDRASTTLTDRRGKTLRARIINVSATGVAIEADFNAMPAATIVSVGQKPVTLGRKIRGGQVFLFDKPLDPARCNKLIVL